MSSNISNWREEKINHLIIPLSALSDKKWFDSPVLVDPDPDRMMVEIHGYAEGFEIQGVLKDGNILVDEIESYGEGSGTFHDALLGALKQSKGELRALLVWEGGELVEYLNVRDGEVRETVI